MTTPGEPALQVRNLSVAYPGPTEACLAVDDVSFELRAGETLAIVGESGAGKSTVGAAIMRLIDPPGRICRGEIVFRNVDLLTKTEDEMSRIRGRQIAMIFQNPATALCPVISVGRQLVWTISQGGGASRRDAERRALELIERVGLSEPRKRFAQYPHQMSGGMKQRIVIALALARSPEVIVADEPTTALDVSVQAEILELIASFRRELGTGIILITHNMAVVSQMSDRVAVMRHGRLVEIGNTGDVLRAPAQPYTRALIKAVPPLDRKLPRFETMSGLETAETTRPTSGPDWFRAGSIAVTPGPLVEVENLTVAFGSAPASRFRRERSGFRAVDDVSFRISPGEIFGIVGESGSGKTTVARTIAGLQRATRGRVSFEGRDVTGLANDPALRTRCLRMQMVFQDPFSSLDPRQTVGDILAEPMRVHGLGDRTHVRAVSADILRRVGLDGAALGKLPHQFSGGQRQRISIARALVMRPSFLICDEPTSALDVSVQAQVLNLLKDLRQDFGVAILFISHDLAVVRQMCDRIAVMQRGKILDEGEAEQIFTRPSSDYTKHLLASTPEFGVPARPHPQTH